MMSDKKTRVFIYENGRKVFGTIEHNDGIMYTILWDDGERTQEVIADFQPAGWVQ